MTIANVSNPNTLTGAPVRGSKGEKLGKIDAIYLDNATDAPEWAAVKSGLFGGHVSLVPLAQADWDGETLTVPFDKQALTAAPHHDPDVAISAADEDELYRHYGLSTGRSADRSATAVDSQASQRRDLTGAAGVQGRDTSGPTTDTAMTRSEEQLKVGTKTHEKGRARLRKHVVTEQQTVSVPVTREEVRVEREPITDANRRAATSGPAISEEEHEVVLREERPVVEKETVPVERVKLGKETVTDQEQVSKKVRKERIDTDGVDSER